MINFKVKKAEEMTTQELIGQIIMIGLPYTYLDESSKEFIKEKRIGNYILFARNYDNTKDMKNFMQDLYEYTVNEVGSYPLVSIDQEGGMVVRLFKDVTFPASPLTTSATSISNAPYITGSIIAKDMLKLGINLNLAPCLEINEKLENPLVNVRGYGANKEIVCKNADAFVKGLQEGGVLSCIKHFPGAGSSTKDSHLELPIINDSKEDLLQYNMYPFSKLSRSDALMTSHCIYSSFDDIPSTLSYELLTSVLRKRMNFNGLIISDGMEMKAITDHYGLGNGCVMALNAGCDILLLCHDPFEQRVAFDAVYDAVDKGIISKEILIEKVERINKAKEQIRNNLSTYFIDEPYEQNLEEQKIMQDIVDSSYTLVLGDAPCLKEKTLILSSNAKVASIVEDEFDERNLTNALIHNLTNVDIIKFTSSLNIDEILNKSDLYDSIIIYSYDAYKDDIQKEVINKLLEKNSNKVYVVSIKGPIDKPYFKNLTNYNCLYEYTPNSIRTIIKQLKNEFKLTGKLPL